MDFNKLLDKTESVKDIDPIAIFAKLDKESGKEYLRPPQEAVLKEWHKKLRVKNDTIIKLHTGQGKTLIGLSILQSYLNEGIGPVVYLCPNNYLVDQTVEQARTFGFKIVQFSPDSPKLPIAFLNSQAILVTNCNKLFNGKSVFGVSGSGKETIHLGAVVMDDAHKCLQIIRDAFSVNIKRKNKTNQPNPLYSELWALFKDVLSRQRDGTCRDIERGREDCLMAVPFWTWYDKRSEVISLLESYKAEEELLYVWDLLKDRLDHTICVFSGNKIEIAPRLLPLDLIPSFSKAQRRIFLSATLSEDAFLVRDLGINPESVTNSLSVGDVPYCGERLIVMPTLVDTSLKRDELVKWITDLSLKHGDFGVVAITPSFMHAKKWEALGAKITNVKNLSDNISDLKDNVKKKTAIDVLVLVNEYDGVDLPDGTCRILCLDSLPSYNSLIDRYMQEIRTDSLRLRQQLAQRVEQGMGRAIRGSSDWCIVIPIGNNLTDFLSENSKRAFLSKEAQMQIRISEELAEDMKSENSKLSSVEKLINQCLTREDGWKTYYKQRMSQLKPEQVSKEQLSRASIEREAEILYQQGRNEQAVDVLQKLVSESDQTDTGWFLQLMATYLYPVNITESMDKQLKAHSKSPQLFRPEKGVIYSKLASTQLNRATKIVEWVKKFESPNALIIHVNSIMDKISFNTSSDAFEEGIANIGQSLGFVTQRPEKTTGRGPDNFWQIANKKCWVIECKNMVSAKRKGISKREIGQLSNAVGWFNEKYPDYDDCIPIMIHPTDVLMNDAYPPTPFWVLKESSLEELKKNTTTFYLSLSSVFSTLSEDLVLQQLKNLGLDTENLMRLYLRRIDIHR